MRRNASKTCATSNWGAFCEFRAALGGQLKVAERYIENLRGAIAELAKVQADRQEPPACS
jgi:hypothetical protein